VIKSNVKRRSNSFKILVSYTPKSCIIAAELSTSREHISIAAVLACVKQNCEKNLYKNLSSKNYFQ